MKSIRITCNVADRVDFKLLNIIQGELKSLSQEGYNNLKKSILKHGIHSPCYVWYHNNQLDLLDGTQRKRTYGQMETEGYKIPLVPIVRVEAPDLATAKQILLTMVSQFGHVEGQGLYEYSLDAGLTLEQLRDYDFPNLNLDKFELEFFKDTVDINEKEVDENIETETECPRCKYRF